jgi:hypothetical protein
MSLLQKVDKILEVLLHKSECQPSSILKIIFHHSKHSLSTKYIMKSKQHENSWKFYYLYGVWTKIIFWINFFFVWQKIPSLKFSFIFKFSKRKIVCLGFFLKKFNFLYLKKKLFEFFIVFFSKMYSNVMKILFVYLLWNFDV